jgi:hypothetical protein
LDEVDGEVKAETIAACCRHREGVRHEALMPQVPPHAPAAHSKGVLRLRLPGLAVGEGRRGWGFEMRAT